MATSEARIAANQRNATLSSGPRSESGKLASRGNSLKHGLTGAGIVLPAGDAVEVARRTVVYAQETGASGEIGMAVARQCALSAVRMERAADQQTASLTAHVRQVDADFVAPEGADEAEAAQLRSEAVRAAMFDPSKEATLARKYEAAAERSFFRCLKKLEQMRKQKPAVAPMPPPAPLGSFLVNDEIDGMTDDEFDALCVEMDKPPLTIPPLPPHFAHYGNKIDISITPPRRR